MADKKITQLTNITGADLVDADEFVVVDISADETKAITLGELKEAFDSGSGFVRITGDTMTGDLALSGADVTFGDNDKAIFGAGSDLQIYHDGSQSYIKDAGTGNLLIQGANIRLESDTGENFLAAFPNAEVRLYYDSVEKLATTSTGIDVTGTVTADGLTVDGSATVNTSGTSIANFNYFGATKGSITTDGINLKHNATANMYFNVNSANRMQIGGTGDISFYEDTGTTPKFFWDASAESLGIGNAAILAPVSLETNTSGYAISLEENAGAETWQIGVDVDGDLNFYNSQLPTPQFTVNDSGNVGIGTGSPSTRLDVSTSTSTIATFRVPSGGGANNKRLEVATGGDRVIFKAYTDSDSSAAAIAFNNGATSEAMRITSSGSVGIGKSSPGAKLDVAGVAIIDGGTGVSSSGVFHVRQNGDGSGNGITITSSNATSHRIWKDSAGSLNIGPSGSPSAFVQNTSGNVGIGTNSPNADLELGGVGEVMRLSGSSTNAYIRNTDGTTNQWYIGSGGNAGLQHYIYQAQPMTFHTSGLERLRIDSSGRVGINTSDPVENLTVGATTTAAGFSLGSATTQAYLRYNNYFSGTSQVSDATKGSASISLGRSSDGVITFNTAAAGAGTPSEAMRITSSGNVGIGESSPDGKIDIAVNGANEKIHSVRPAGGSGSPQFGFKFRWGDDGDSPEIGLTHGGSYSNAGLYFDTMSGGSKVSAMRIDSSGNVDIGSTGGSTKLSIAGGVGTQNGTEAAPTHTFYSDSNTGMYRPAADHLGFSTGGSEAMRLDSSGNLLVGKTSPAGVSTNGAEIRNDGTVVATKASGISGYFGRTGNDGEIMRFYRDSTTVGSIGISGNIYLAGVSSGLRIRANDIIPVDNTGAGNDNALDLGISSQRWKDLYLSGGVYLGGTGAANKLDDYEEGTWTPTASFYSGSMTVVSAEYTKIGHLVLIKARLTFDGTSDSDNVQIAGLPFSMSSTKRGGGFIIVDGSGSINSFSYATATSLYARNTAAALQTYNAIGANTIEFWFMYEAS